MEAAAEADNITERGMKEASKEAEVKAATANAAAKASNSVSSEGNLSAATAASTAASMFTRDPTSSVVGDTRRSGYTFLIIML